MVIIPKGAEMKIGVKEVLVGLVLLVIFVASPVLASDYDLVSATYVDDAVVPAKGASAAKAADISGAVMYGSDTVDTVLLYADCDTADTETIGSTPSLIAGLAFHQATGILYGISSASGGALYVIDQATGAAQYVGHTNISYAHGLAIDPATGVLYATSWISDLYSIDPGTGSATLIGPLGYANITALDFDPTTGVLYGAYSYANSDGWLLTIDTATGLATEVSTAHRFSGIAFDHFGQLYGVDNRSTTALDSWLYAIDKHTAEATFIGELIGRKNVLGLDLSPLIFTDGFETGDTSEWSSAIP